jgi:hypothetical protein
MACRRQIPVLVSRRSGNELGQTGDGFVSHQRTIADQTAPVIIGVRGNRLERGPAAFSELPRDTRDATDLLVRRSE